MDIMRVPDGKDLTTKEILNIIDEKLVERTGDAKKLWDVLSALRGPDYEDVVDYNEIHTPIITALSFPSGVTTLKHETTGVIRAQAFPKATKGWLGEIWAVNTEQDFVVYNPRLYYSHFMRHIREAALALHLSIR